MHRVPTPGSGAASGTFAAALFVAIHDVLISDIWFNIVPMSLAGAACGGCLVWSYRATTDRPTTRRWWRHVARSTLLLALLAPASVLLLDDRWTMAEIMVLDDPVSLLMPAALPVMGAGIVVGTTALWLWSGRRWSALGPILVSQALLVFLLGHQLAFLGLVDLDSSAAVALAEFGGLVLLLAGLFGVGVHLLAWRPGGGGTPEAG